MALFLLAHPSFQPISFPVSFLSPRIWGGHSWLPAYFTPVLLQKKPTNYPSPLVGDKGHLNKLPVLGRAGAKVCRAALRNGSVPSVPGGDTPVPAATRPGDSVPGQTGHPAVGWEVGRGVGIQGQDVANEPLLSPKTILPKIIHHCAPASSPQTLPDGRGGSAASKDTLL